MCWNKEKKEARFHVEDVLHRDHYYITLTDIILVSPDPKEVLKKGKLRQTEPFD